MTTSTISRRHFLGAVGATVAGLGTAKLFGAPSIKDNIRLGMMCQAGSAAGLQEAAKAIAAAGFDAVQVTMFFQPTSEELKAVARTLKDLKLKTLAFGTYFNQFRPDDPGFMGSTRAAMKLVAEHAELFNCKQFVSWSGSYSPHFGGAEPRNHTPEAVKQMHSAIREVILPILDPINGRVAFEPYFPHVLGSVELAKEILAPFPNNRVGLLLDPPRTLSPPSFIRNATEEILRMFRELGKRIHMVHLKDMKLSANGQSVDLPGPGAGEMNYPQLVSELHKLKRPVPCIIEHIKAETAVMIQTKAWVEKQLGRSRS